MIAIDLVLPHHSVEAAIHHLMDTMGVDHRLLVATALVGMTTVVVRHLPVTTTTLVIAAIVRRLLLAQPVPLLTIPTRPLAVVMAAMTLTEHPLLVVLMMTRTAPMDTIDLGRDLRHLGHMGGTMSVHRQDTRDCSPD